MATHANQGSRPSYARVESQTTPIMDEFQLDDPRAESKSPLIPTPRQITSPSMISLVGDIILTAAPAFFLVLCISALVLHHQPTEDNSFGAHIEDAIKLGPTLFPILFAAVVGRSMKMIARHSAEKGAKLGSLELLTSSQSIWATFETQLRLSRFTTVGFLLLVLWALSPLGGQASLRLLDKEYHMKDSGFPVRYLMTGPAAPIWPSGGFGDVGTEFEYMENSLFITTLLSPDTTKTGLQDTWGNVKIPRIESLNQSTKDAGGWIDIPTATTAETFSSLVGLPVVGLPTDANSTFNLESSYLSLACSTPDKIPKPTAEGWETIVGYVWNGTDLTNSSGFSPLNPLPGEKSASSSAGSVSPTFFLDTYLEPDNTVRLDGYFGLNDCSEYMDNVFNETRTIVFGSLTQDQHGNDSLVLTNCSISETHVESIVNCTEAKCGASKIRTSVSNTQPAQLTALDVGIITAIFFTELPQSGGGDPGQGLSSAVEIFINNTSLEPYNKAVYNNGLVDLSLLSEEAISTRLSIVLNTYFQIMTFPGSFVGDRDQNLTAYGPNTTPVDAIKTWFAANATLDDVLADIWQSTDQGMPAVKDSPFAAASSNGTATRGTEIYVCNFAWLVVLFISTIVLLGTGIYGLVLKNRTLAPDVLGYVASMTYENHVKLPPGGSTLDAIDRARELRELKVRIGDVRGDDNEVGYIVLTDDMKIRSLEKGRKYL